MQKFKPMDMLLCGDVGFGKTEVAFRAMFKAVNDGKQVAYLCPTTILSSQQYNNALKRFSKFPVNIALLNRFTPLKEERQILENLQNEKILQLYFDNDNIVTMLGKRKYDALETKDEYLEVDSVAFGNTVFLALSNLSKKIEDKNSKKSYQKAYKISGSDKYQILKNRNENIGG